jgi:hypothetical protein
MFVILTLHAHRAGRIQREGVIRIALLLMALGGWFATSAALSLHGFYLDERARAFFPLVLGTAAPVTVILAGLVFWPSLRRDLIALVVTAPLEWLIALQSLRIAAVGTIVLWVEGELPGYFIVPVAFPDLAIGLSAPVISYLVRSGRGVSRRVLVAWNLAGAAVFLLAQPLLHLSVPGPLRVIYTEPTTAEVFHFPMVLVPTFVAPLLVVVHLVTVWKLLAGGLSVSPAIPPSNKSCNAHFGGA